MKQVSIFSTGAPPSFTVPTSDSNYWLMRLCYEESVQRYNESLQGMATVQVEVSDYDALNTAVSDIVQSVSSWLASAPEIDDGTNPQTRGLPSVPTPGLPSILTAAAAILAGGGTPAVIGALAVDLILGVGTDLMSKWLAGKIYPGGDGSLSELVKIMRKIFLHDPGVLNLERSVFKAEFPSEGAIGGSLRSFGQMFLEYLENQASGGEWVVKANVGEQEVILSQAQISGPGIS